jgi:26S proteasome regulatory subunit N10
MQRQHVIAFICSPPEVEDERKIKEIALKYRKSNIVCDLVLIGDAEEDERTREALERFVGHVGNDKGEAAAQIIRIKPSGRLLSDQLLDTTVLGEDGAARAGGGGGGGGGAAGNSAGVDEFGEFDFDPAMEPDLALALRMSMEEERARQERVAKQQEEEALKASLEAVKEEDEPLLDKDGNPAAGKGEGEDKDKGDGKDDKGDKMDTS